MKMIVRKEGFIEESSDDKLANFLFHKIKKLEEEVKSLNFRVDNNNVVVELNNIVDEKMKPVKKQVSILRKRSLGDTLNLESLNDNFLVLGKRVRDLSKRVKELMKNEK